MLDDTVKEIINNEKRPEKKAKAIFNFVRDEIKFDIYVDFPDVGKILKRKAGACYHKAMVMVEMMKLAGIPARYHFVWIRKGGLKNILHPLVYRFWPEKFIHTYAEIKLNNKWIMLDATYDKKLHNKLIKSRLNFSRNKSNEKLDIDFSLQGSKSAQDLYIVEDAGCGDDLGKLKEHIRELPTFKRISTGLAGWLSQKQVKKIKKATAFGISHCSNCKEERTCK